MQPPPPADVGELAAFPSREIPADFPYARIHDQWNEPEWFCGTAAADSSLPAGPHSGLAM